ncbi:MAG: tetratricopeptide repeat protein [Alphaproteobacteria bacterium]|nr:tetratricopeptide repeat protein [Alphaproteobacteria bacterium]
MRTAATILIALATLVSSISLRANVPRKIELSARPPSSATHDRIVLPDCAVIFEKYRLAALEGDRTAMPRYGWMLGNSVGRSTGWAKSVPWLRVGAEAGIVWAQTALGSVLKHINWYTGDLAEARHWLTVAAEAGDPEAMYELAGLVTRGLPNEAAKREANAWYARGADLGHVDSIYLLALNYALGEVVPKDRRKYLELVQVAAAKGDADAQDSLGRHYLRGSYGVPKNWDMARLWYERAARQGNVEAARQLALLFADPAYRDHDMVEALRWAILSYWQGLFEAEELRKLLSKAEIREAERRAAQTPRKPIIETLPWDGSQC